MRDLGEVELTGLGLVEMQGLGLKGECHRPQRFELEGFGEKDHGKLLMIGGWL